MKKITNKQTPVRELTDAQADVLAFIRNTCGATGVPPSYRDIQKHFGYKAVGTVQDHVRALRDKGALENASTGKKRQARSLIPAGHRPEGVKRLDIFGEVAAGSTRTAEQLKLGSVFVPDNFAKDPCFALRVSGDSMVDLGIFEGDYVIVEKNRTPKDGDIVVALLDGETTVKRYERRGGDVFLMPANAKLKPIPTAGRAFEVQGRVVGLQRKL